jgi:nucleoside-diphosphate-sugar epimerase
MRVLITGGLGHIGSYLITFFAKKYKGSEIAIVDNLSSQRYSSLFNLDKTSNYNFIDSDIRDTNLSEILENVEVCIHLAAITNAAESFNNALELENNNFECTKIIAEECGSHGKKLISLSSTSVYGSQRNIVKEDVQEDLNPQSPYAETKLKEEEILKEYNNKFNLSCVIPRFGTIYGTSPGMRFHTAVNKFCYQASINQPITVWKTAYEQRRPYLDISDAAVAIDHMISKDLFHGEIFNILTNNATVKEVTDIIKEYYNDLKIDFVENEIMNQLSYEVSKEKFLETGFEYQGDMKARIFETLDMLRLT